MACARSPSRAADTVGRSFDRLPEATPSASWARVGLPDPSSRRIRRWSPCDSRSGRRPRRRSRPARSHPSPAGRLTAARAGGPPWPCSPADRWGAESRVSRVSSSSAVIRRAPIRAWVKTTSGPDPLVVAVLTLELWVATATANQQAEHHRGHRCHHQEEVEGPPEATAHPDLGHHQEGQQPDDQQPGQDDQPGRFGVVLVGGQVVVLDGVELAGRRQHLGPHEVVGLADVGGGQRVVGLSFVERGRLDQAGVDRKVYGQGPDGRGGRRVAAGLLGGRGQAGRGLGQVGHVPGCAAWLARPGPGGRTRRRWCRRRTGRCRWPGTARPAVRPCAGHRPLPRGARRRPAR